MIGDGVGGEGVWRVEARGNVGPNESTAGEWLEGEDVMRGEERASLARRSDGAAANQVKGEV